MHIKKIHTQTQYRAYVYASINNHDTYSPHVLFIDKICGGYLILEV